jgi:hypothetical protein
MTVTSSGHTSQSSSVSPPESAASEPARLGPLELTRWLTARVPELQERWFHEIRSRELGQGAAFEPVVQQFVSQLVYFLPFLMGPYRDQILPIWDRAAELYGAVAAKRGLAAGEAIEELQILRELVIRDLYRDPPLGGAAPLSLREILRLNRALDRGVTHASIGHTDAMFFQFFEGDGATSLLRGDDVAVEAGQQLSGLSDQVTEILEHARARPSQKGAGN